MCTNLRIYSDMFRLLEAIFGLNIKECIYIYRVSREECARLQENVP